MTFRDLLARFPDEGLLQGLSGAEALAGLCYYLFNNWKNPDIFGLVIAGC